MESIEDRVSALYVPQRGCVWSRFIVRRDLGIWGNVSLWHDLSHLEALKKDPEMLRIAEEIRGLLTGAPEEEIYELYEPKGTPGGGSLGS